MNRLAMRQGFGLRQSSLSADPSLHTSPASIKGEETRLNSSGTPDGPTQTAALTATYLHEQYLGTIFRYVSRRIPQRQDAEDVTAEVFAAAFQALPRFRGQIRVELWLLGIARRKVADAMRHKYRRRELLTADLPEHFAGLGDSRDPQSDLERAEARQKVRELVARLKPDQQEALLLQHVERLSITDIALVMERSPAAVNSLLQRARAALYRSGQSYFLQDRHETTGYSDYNGYNDNPKNEVRK